MTLGVGVVLMLFFNSPGKNPFLNFGLGLWDTYNNLTGILSDVLSYIRLFASDSRAASRYGVQCAGRRRARRLGYSGAAADCDPDPAHRPRHQPFMSTISSFVHPMRLTFVEFYKNAGFEMSMRTFDPCAK